jgi:hypothetical protein
MSRGEWRCRIMAGTDGRISKEPKIKIQKVVNEEVGEAAWGETNPTRTRRWY